MIATHHHSCPAARTTTSYLLARKKKAPDFLKKLARLTGDSLEEKGKNRQLFCGYTPLPFRKKIISNPLVNCCYI